MMLSLYSWCRPLLIEGRQMELGEEEREQEEKRVEGKEEEGEKERKIHSRSAGPTTFW